MGANARKRHGAVEVKPKEPTKAYMTKAESQAYRRKGKLVAETMSMRARVMKAGRYSEDYVERQAEILGISLDESRKIFETIVSQHSTEPTPYPNEGEES